MKFEQINQICCYFKFITKNGTNMLIKREPKLSWFINLLSILLMCLLIANSLLGSIYIHNLKNRMTNLTDNYFLTHGMLLSANESLAQVRLDLFNYAFIIQSSANEANLEEQKKYILLDFQKNEINLSSLILRLKKQSNNTKLNTPLTELYSSTTDYLLNMEKIFSMTTSSFNINKIMNIIENTNHDYLKIKEHLNIISDILKQKAYEVKDSETLISQYFPPILLTSFFIALIIGGSLIYVSRREVKTSILSLTTEALTEAYQYEQDCLQNLEACKQITENKLLSLKKESLFSSEGNLQNELKYEIEQFIQFTKKIQTSLEMRKELHHEEMKNLKRVINQIQTKN